MTFSVNRERGDSDMQNTPSPTLQEGRANRDSKSVSRNFSNLIILLKNMNDRHTDMKKTKK
jgi:hypothetical protein